MASRSGQKSILGYASVSPANAVESEPTKDVPSNASNKKSRGTRFDSDGKVTIRGTRNITGSEVFVTKDEIYDDVMIRGMRKTGIARKFGISEKGDSVKSFLEEMFRDDPRHNEVLTAMQVKQGKRAGNIFDPLSRTEAKVGMACEVCSIDID